MAQAKSAGKEIEFLFFEGDSKLVAEHGKGAGEAEIMEFIFQNSELIKSVDCFYKLTGRVIIKNLDTVLKKCKQQINYFQFHSKRNTSSPFVESVFYKMNCADFLQLKNMKYAVNDRAGIYFEHTVWQKLQENNISYHFFPVYPVRSGVSGSTGSSYDESWKRLLVKRILCRLRVLEHFY